MPRKVNMRRLALSLGVLGALLVPTIRGDVQRLIAKPRHSVLYPCGMPPERAAECQPLLASIGIKELYVEVEGYDKQKIWAVFVGAAVGFMIPVLFLLLGPRIVRAIYHWHTSEISD